MTLVQGLRVSVLFRGANGGPAATIDPPMGHMINRGLRSYEQNIGAHIGFESLSLGVTLSFDEALDWLNLGLSRWIIVYGPDAEILWEGYVSTVSLRIGDETVTSSLDTMFNQVRVRYTTTLGSAGITATLADTTSQGIYGTKDIVLALGDSTSTAATALATRALAQYKMPRPVGESTITASGSGASGGIEVTITAVGWYTSLEWVVTSRTSTTLTDSVTQVATLIGTSPPGIGATNNFFSTSTTFMVAGTGISDTEFIATETTYREKIEALLRQGTSGGESFAWGVYEDRVFHIDTWAGATPTVIDYTRRLEESVVRTPTGGIVPWWNVRPNTMYQRSDFLDVGPTLLTPDAAGRMFVERVRCSISGDSVSLSIEGSSDTAIDAIIARMS